MSKIDFRARLATRQEKVRTLLCVGLDPDIKEMPDHLKKEIAELDAGDDFDVDRGSPAEAAGLRRGMVVTGIDNQYTHRFVALAKVLYGKKKDDHATLDLVIPQQRGRFVQIQQAKVEVAVR